MNRKEYLKLVDKYTPKEACLKNLIYAFISGGVIGLLGTLVYEFLLKINISVSNASSYVLLIIIFLSSLSTGLGYFDKLAEKFKCGIIIPISGFAHSVTSAKKKEKRDGLITGIGASVFKLAGSVILYGVVTSFVLVIVRVIISG